jgi:glycosyltransferase 2 family protein
VIGLAVSAASLFGLYRQIDGPAVVEALNVAPLGWVLATIGLIVPLTVLRALRFLWTVPPGAVAGLGEAIRLTLVASTLNLFVPGKAGDLVKSFFVVKQGGAKAGTAVGAVVFERVADLFGLVSWCGLGLLLGGPPPGVPEASLWLVLLPAGTVCAVLLSGLGTGLLSVPLGPLVRDPSSRAAKIRDLLAGWPALHRSLRGRRLGLVGFSLGLWMLQLTQVWLFARVVGLQVPFALGLTIAGLALVAGQVPFTFGGLGTRDLALVGLLSSQGAPEAAAAVGLLTATRNFLPPLAGVAVLRCYLAELPAVGRVWRSRD